MNDSDEEETTFCPRVEEMVPLTACGECPLWDSEGDGCSATERG